MRIFRKFQTTSKLCETDVKVKKIVLPTIYDKKDKLIAFICEKIQYCFSCSLIYTHIFLFIFIFSRTPNLIRIMTFLTKSRNTFKQTTFVSLLQI